MTRIFIFAGTTEGRELSEQLSESGFEITISVATEYGAKLLPKSEKITILQGRLDSERMVSAFLQKDYAFVVDATHPFATEVSKEIKKACNYTKIPYLRLARNTGSEGISKCPSVQSQNLLYFDDVSSAADWLESQEGKIFITTGSKELPKISQKITDKARLIVRVLPSEESIKICHGCGISQEQIIAMQGPFSEETNSRQFDESGAKILLTKESGVKGGYFEKIRAAKKLGMKIAVIKNPEKDVQNDCGQIRIFHSVEDILCALSNFS